MSREARVRGLFTSPESVATAFYEAFEARDVEAMMALWADDEEIVCVHPGGPRLLGYEAIRHSWEQLFNADARLSFRLESPVQIETIGLAMQSVVEYVTVDNDPSPRGAAIATNVFIRTPSGWRMVMHHASAVATGQADPVDPPRQLH